MKVAVIGAGIGGLAIATRLANKGYDVTVYEKNSLPGGKISEIHEQGYRFDTGPSLFTLPSLLENLFSECGEKLSNYMQYTLLESNCKYFFDDQTRFSFYQDKNKLKAEIEENTSETFDSIQYRLDTSEEVYNISAPVFLFSNFHKLSNFNTPPYKKIALKLFKLKFFRTMHRDNAKSFKDKRIVQLFDRYATYNGSNPYKAPATLNMIAHLENNIGAFFPSEGMYSIIDSVYKLALKKGVHFEFNSLVSKILIENKRASSIIVNGKREEYDIIVSDTDAKYLVNNMMTDSPMKSRVNRAVPSSSALIFYWGINKKFSELDVHNILFSAEYKEEFDTIFKRKSIINDPTVYIFISSKVVKSDAPIDCENWFTMINVPSNTGQNWDDLITNARKNIIKKINKTLNTDIEKYIQFECKGSPLTIEKNTLSANGALYGSASNSMFSAFLRHPNVLNGVKNLYFVGGSVHPGGGIPLCIASSQIVSDEITSLKK